jgi:hypothetical protein
MKKELTFLFVFLCVISSIQAQLQVNTGSGKPKIKSLSPLAHSFTDFINAIKPSSFNSEFPKEKGKFITAASSVATPEDLGKSLSRLVGYIKPSKLNAAFKTTAFIKATLHTTTMEGAKGSLKDLENNLKSGAMTDIWKLQRNGWLVDLNGY